VALAACRDAVDPARESAVIPIHSDVGSVHREVTTDSPEAQQWFDRGLALMFRFHHEEGIACFEKAAADSMREVRAAVPGDAEARALTGEALMQLRPWGLLSPAAVSDLFEILVATPYHVMVRFGQRDEMPREAEAVHRRFRTAWARSDTVIPGSCFCKTGQTRWTQPAIGDFGENGWMRTSTAELSSRPTTPTPPRARPDGSAVRRGFPWPCAEYGPQRRKIRSRRPGGPDPYRELRQKWPLRTENPAPLAYDNYVQVLKFGSEDPRMSFGRIALIAVPALVAVAALVIPAEAG
jgi:hypothetical protein